MFKNYIKILWRNMLRQPTYALLNLAGLSVGIAAALIILLYLDFELNYDRFHEKKDRIYRIETTAIETHQKVIDVNWERTSAPFAQYVKQDFPDVEQMTRFYQFFRDESVTLELEGKKISEDQLMVADASLLEVFSFDFIYGDDKTALNEPNKIILSESVAHSIFGDQNPVGRILNCRLNHIRPDVKTDYQLMVNGVYRDFPNNSHIPAHAFISATTDPKLADYVIGHFNFYTYVLLKEGVQPVQLAAKLPQIYEQYIDPEKEPVLKRAIHALVPLTKIHLNATGGYTYLYIFAAIGFLLLLISMISYVNLVTAQASRRALEIGVRKVMGSNRQQLIFQFLGESLFFTVIALIFALLLVYFSIKPLNTFLALALEGRQLAQPQIILGLVGILLILGLLGGSYPAFFLSNFQPIAIMKGQMTKNTPLRSTLVGIQFAVVLIVLVSTGMIRQQLQFLRSKDLGFNRQQIVQLNFPDEAALQKANTLKTTLLQNPLIGSVSTASFIPGIGMTRRPLSADNGTTQESQFVDFGNIDYDFLKAMDIELVAGRNFSLDFPNDEHDNLLVNEMLVEQFGLKDPIGEKVRFGDKNNPDFKTIVGVISDFHQTTLHQPIAPQMFLLAPTNFNIAVKIEKDFPTAIAHMEKTWQSIFPNTTFDYRFLDDALQTGYETDQIRGNIFFLFSVLTVFITFLGLFGLVAFIAQQRVKEIGIRKVLGASLSSIIFLISKDFLRLVLLAALPAFGIAWYLVNHWLQDFAFRTTIKPLVFVVVLGFALLFTLGITSLYAFRTAQLNPAETLKSD